MSITYLTYPQIDKNKWDGCINQSRNRLIYAQSFYLDAMAENWDALVLNDYEAVMPLTWKKKWGVRYLYQPAFMQQGGIFFTNRLAPSTIKGFIDNAFIHFKFAEFTLNYFNDLTGLVNGQLSMRTNYVLSLSKTYEQIYASYPAITIKNIKRANNASLQYTTTSEYMPVLQLYEKLYAKRLPYFSSGDYINFERVCKKLAEENNLIVRKVISGQNELLAATVLLKDNKRLYNIISCVIKKGKLAQANYFLYDRLIQEFCNKEYQLDFEGSDVKGIAEFYCRFPVKNEMYPFIKINNLHPFLKLFKH